MVYCWSSLSYWKLKIFPISSELNGPSHDKQTTVAFDPLITYINDISYYNVEVISSKWGTEYQWIYLLVVVLSTSSIEFFSRLHDTKSKKVISNNLVILAICLNTTNLNADTIRYTLINLAFATENLVKSLNYQQSRLWINLILLKFNIFKLAAKSSLWSNRIVFCNNYRILWVLDQLKNSS